MNRSTLAAWLLIISLSAGAQSAFDGAGAFVPLGAFAGTLMEHTKGGYHVHQDTSDLPDYLKESGSTVVLQISDGGAYHYAAGAWVAVSTPGGGSGSLQDAFDNGADIDLNGGQVSIVDIASDNRILKLQNDFWEITDTSEAVYSAVYAWLNTTRADVVVQRANGSMSFTRAGDQNFVVFQEEANTGKNAIIQTVGNGAATVTPPIEIKAVGAQAGTMMVLHPEGSVDAYYDNVKKLATTATGITVTGDIVANNIFDGLPSSLDQEAATSGQVLKWNGSAWAPASDIGGGTGDDWGAQVVVSDGTLSGTGITGSVLAVDTTVIGTKYDLSLKADAAHVHVEADISDLDHFTGADITGSEAAFTGWDKDTTNEIQSIQQVLNIGSSALIETDYVVTRRAGFQDVDGDTGMVAVGQYYNSYGIFLYKDHNSSDFNSMQFSKVDFVFDVSNISTHGRTKNQLSIEPHQSTVKKRIVYTDIDSVLYTPLTLIPKSYADAQVSILEDSLDVLRQKLLLPVVAVVADRALATTDAYKRLRNTTVTDYTLDIPVSLGVPNGTRIILQAWGSDIIVSPDATVLLNGVGTDMTVDGSGKYSAVVLEKVGALSWVISNL